MPLFIIERNFSEKLELDRGGAARITEVNDDCNVHWLFSFLSADKKKTYCLYEAPSAEAIREAAREHERPLTINRVGSLLGIFFNPGPVDSWEAVTKSDVGAYRSFFHSMLDQGVYFAPSAFEAAFVSTVHTPEDLELTLEAARKAMAPSGD